ncbi:RNase H family protein [Nocardioides gilvus]|uniref:RNase H family protein n=1 Tax=Nocardioides gilvus TaxID=1735589 RepID=UPI000D744242|nr:RNase H family protein [Nocardioides gilvus]
MTIIAAADGSALGNPGPAGWGWYSDDDHWACGGWPNGTNNMGELMAVLDLLQQTAHLDEPLHVICDSTYVINSITKWMKGWKRKGWKKGDGKPVMNVEIMKALDAAMQGRQVTFEWVKGHSGHRLNEEADRLATTAAEAWKAGGAPDPGPGFRVGRDEAPAPGAAHPRAVPGQVETEDDLFSFLDADDSAPGTAAPTDPVAQVLIAEQALLSDDVRTDRASVAALLHPQWSEVGASGRIWTREEFLAEVGPLGAVTFDVVQAEEVDADTVLLVWRGSRGAGAGADHVLRSSWWVRVQGRWVQRFHHASLVAG